MSLMNKPISTQGIHIERYGSRYYISNINKTAQLAVKEESLESGNQLAFSKQFFTSFKVRCGVVCPQALVHFADGGGSGRLLQAGGAVRIQPRQRQWQRPLRKEHLPVAL